MASSFSLASILAAEFSAVWFFQATVYTSKWRHGPVFVSRSFWVGANRYLLVGDMFRLKGMSLWDFPTVGVLLSLLRLKGWTDHMREQEPSHVISLMLYMNDSSGLGGTGHTGLLWIVIGLTSL